MGVSKGQGAAEMGACIQGEIFNPKADTNSSSIGNAGGSRRYAEKGDHRGKYQSMGLPDCQRNVACDALIAACSGSIAAKAFILGLKRVICSRQAAK